VKVRDWVPVAVLGVVLAVGMVTVIVVMAVCVNVII
jgi:hypothetical protein